MSHFAVAVITPFKPNSDLLQSVMQPFHEYECTGIKDKYVVGVDKTEETLEEYQNSVVSGVFDKSGKFLGTWYDSQFDRYWKRQNDYARSSSDEFVIPKGVNLEAKKVPASQVYSFREWLADYFGSSLDGEYSELTDDGRYIRYTNPNATWDWWTIGGRWRNMLVNKSGENLNSCIIGDLDFDGVAKSNLANANKVYDYFLTCIGDAPENERTWMTWDEVCKENPDVSRDVMRNIYFGQAAIKAIQAKDTELEKKFHIFGPSIDDFRCSRQEYLNKTPAPFLTYNMLIASESNTEHLGWYGGEMGWFGMGSQKEDWNKTFQDLIRSQPQDHWVTIVDCHI